MSKEGYSLRDLWRACLEDPRDSTRWEALLTIVYPMLSRTASRVACQWGVAGAAQLDDLIQEIYLKISAGPTSILRHLPDDNAAAHRYLKVLAANTVRDSLRAHFARKRGTQITIPLDDHPEASAASMTGIGAEREVLLAELDNLLEGSTMELAIFRLYYRQGLTAKEIAQIPAVRLSAKGVESLIHRMTAALRSRMRVGSGRECAGFDRA